MGGAFNAGDTCADHDHDGSTHAYCTKLVTGKSETELMAKATRLSTVRSIAKNWHAHDQSETTDTTSNAALIVVMVVAMAVAVVGVVAVKSRAGRQDQYAPVSAQMSSV